MKITVKFKPARTGLYLPLPQYETDGAAGIDLRSAEDGKILPGERKLFKCGFSVEIPEGFEGQVRPRSGLALKHGVTVLNAPATLDSDYRGEIGILLINHGQEPYLVRFGDRIAQLVIAPVMQCRIEAAESLSETGRSGGGFGSTGI